MPPNLRRFLPLILVAFFLLFLLPTLLKKKTTSGPSASARAAQTINAMNLIDKAEQAYKTAHGGSDRQTFVAQVESNVLSLVRARSGKTLIAHSCLIVKSGSGVKCPA